MTQHTERTRIDQCHVARPSISKVVSIFSVTLRYVRRIPARCAILPSNGKEREASGSFTVDLWLLGIFGVYLSSALSDLHTGKERGEHKWILHSL